jgi:AraC-like DNA-binding protein
MTYIPEAMATAASPTAPVVRELHAGAGLRVLDYLCSSQGTTMAEHEQVSLIALRRGSFCYADHGYTRLLEPGALVLGCPGDAYRCSHDYGHGDHCTIFQFTANAWEAMGGRARPAVFAQAPRLEALLQGDLTEAGYELAALTTGLAEVPPSLRRGDRDRAHVAAALIETDYALDLTLEGLAAAVDTSPFHFLRLFKRELGLTPHQYLIKTRLRRAVHLLAEGRSSTEVALAVGFGDLSNFTRTFHRQVGLPPGKIARFSKRQV